MGALTIHSGEVDRAIEIMREVAAWGKSRKLRVWPEEWLTTEELLTEEAQPENFYVGTLDGEAACAYVLRMDAGFKIMKTLERNGVPIMFLYELDV